MIKIYISRSNSLFITEQRTYLLKKIIDKLNETKYYKIHFNIYSANASELIYDENNNTLILISSEKFIKNYVSEDAVKDTFIACLKQHLFLLQKWKVKLKSEQEKMSLLELLKSENK